MCAHLSDNLHVALPVQCREDVEELKADQLDAQLDAHLVAHTGWEDVQGERRREKASGGEGERLQVREECARSRRDRGEIEGGSGRGGRLRTRVGDRARSREITRDRTP